MAVHASHASLPYPIKGARYSLLLPFLDADGDPTAPTTPDTEISKDNGAAADCAEEVSATSGMDGMSLLTLSGAETDCSCAALNAKVASGPKATLATVFPRVLASVGTGTLSAGSAGGGTLGTILGFDITGCFIKTTGGTGGGGTGGANNQARYITSYTMSTGAFTVEPNWETTVDATTTYSVLLPEGVTLGMFKALNITAMILADPLIPQGIDVADTATWRIGLLIRDMLGALSTTGQITPGTISIDRKVQGATSWTSVVTDAACSESAGLIYYDEVFDAATGYLQGDLIRITFKSQAVVVGGTTFAISDSTGRTFYTGLFGPLDAVITSVTTPALTQIKSSLVDALSTDTYAEPGQGAPGATLSIASKLGYIYKAWRNRGVQTSSQYSLYADNATTVDQKATFSANGTTADRGEIASGP